MIILFLKTHNFPQAILLVNCLLLRTDVSGQIQCVCQHIFAPNGGYCLFIKYYQLNILCHPSQVDFPDCQASYSSFFSSPVYFSGQFEVQVYTVLYLFVSFFLFFCLERKLHNMYYQYQYHWVQCACTVVHNTIL